MAKKKKPVNKGGRPSKYPSDPEVAKQLLDIVYNIGAKGGSRHDIARYIGISYKTYLEWVNPDGLYYQGDEFVDAVESGMTAGAASFLQRCYDRMIETPGEDRMNPVIMKFIAQHQYGLVDKTKVENEGAGIKVVIDKDDAEL